MPPKKVGKKRLYFDPEAAKMSAKRKKEANKLTKQLNETADDFAKYSANSVSNDVDFEECSQLCTELFLVTSIGIKGVYSLKMAAEDIPTNYPGRLSVITAVVNQNLTGDHCIAEGKCEALLKALNASTIGTSSLKTGHNHRTMTYLTPPISNCIQQGCSAEIRLVRHHDPVDATIFTMKGPVFAKKQLLKYTKCTTIYGYSMYGHKTTDGERYYTEQRPYIEVNDTTFCDRLLFEFFCNLRLIAADNMQS